MINGTPKLVRTKSYDGSLGRRSLGLMPSGLGTCMIVASVGYFPDPTACPDAPVESSRIARPSIIGLTWSNSPPFSSNVSMKIESFHEGLLISAVKSEFMKAAPGCMLLVFPGCSSRPDENPGSIYEYAGRVLFCTSVMNWEMGTM